MKRMLLPALALAFACAGACDKSGSSDGKSSASADPAKSDKGDKVPTPTGSSASAATSAPLVQSSIPTPASAAGKEFACGAKGMPKCPLQKWMSDNMQPALASGDPKKLADVLRQSAKLGPASYSDWAKIANDGAAAVEASKDVKDGKPSCKACHEQYQKPYKADLRDRPI